MHTFYGSSIGHSPELYGTPPATNASIPAPAVLLGHHRAATTGERKKKRWNHAKQLASMTGWEQETVNTWTITALRRMRLCLELARKLRVAAWMTTAACDLRAWRLRYALWMINVARLTQ